MNKTSSPSPESTARLVERIRAGDTVAQANLIERYFESLHRWARGRLPRYARSEMNTEDLVQETMARALERMKAFEAQESGSFLAYLRRILKNRILDEIRKVHRRPKQEELDDSMEGDEISPIDSAIGSEQWARYEAALARLPAEQQEGVIMRLELQFTHQQVADALGMSSSNAARMMVSRAIARMTEWLSSED